MEPKHKILERNYHVNFTIDVELSDLIDQELLSKLDSIKRSTNLYKPFSAIYIGGIFALSKENRRLNPDWMSQSANSFREILYTLKQLETKQLKEVLTDYFRKSLTKEDIEKYKKYLSNLYSLFSGLAHHFSTASNLNEIAYEISEGFVIKANELDEGTYFEAIRLYKDYLKLLVITSIEIYRKIDAYLSEGNKDVNIAKVFVKNSLDAKVYFFAKADRNLIRWLWTNSFFAYLKKPVLNSEGNYNEFPELEYLRRIAREEPETVTDIIQSIPISESNSIIVYQLFWIVGILPVKQIKKLIDKIENEKWISLINTYRISGYDLKELVAKLIDERDTGFILKIAKSILTIKPKNEFNKSETSFMNESPFIVSHVIDSGILDALCNIRDSQAKAALKIGCEKLSEIIQLGKTSKREVFAYNDLFSLYNIDMFSLDIQKIGKDTSSRKDFLAFVSMLKLLIERTFSKSGRRVSVRVLFDNIDLLPTSRFTWRLRLFTLAQCPKFLKQELRKTFFKLFEVESPFDIEGGTEYQKSLKICFPYLSKIDQRLYIQNVFRYYSEKAKNNPEQSWHNSTGWQIMSCIKPFLTLKDANNVKTTFGYECDENYIPQPEIREIRSGYVSHESPVKISSYSIPDIIRNLKTEWTPRKLKEQYKNDDFLKPRRAEGLGNELRSDIKKRTDEYLSYINDFLDIESLDLHYLYSLIRGIEEMLREGLSLTIEQAKLLLNFFSNLANNLNILKTINGLDNESEKLGRWTELNKVSIDVLVYILQNKTGKEIANSYENVIIKLIQYWFSFSHSPSSFSEKKSPQDLHGIAINSIRGRAYEAFIEFAIKRRVLTDDIKIIFNQALNDESYALQFCIGRYLSIFYYIDDSFIKDLLPQLFPYKHPELLEKYVAAWSGYLSNNLPLGLYDILEEYYNFAIKLDSENLNDKNTLYKSFDELLAIHLALAFIYSNLEIDTNLFVQFWKKENIARHREFITFIGQNCLTNDKISDDWFIKNNVSKSKLLQFWDWCLLNVSEAEVLSGFGFWINFKKEVLADNIVIERMTFTIKKANGKIWEYGFIKRLPFFAKINGHKTLEAITFYLFDQHGKINSNRHKPFYYDKEIKDALQIIYQNESESLRQKVMDLINSLINEGGRTFWDLEEILN